MITSILAYIGGFVVIFISLGYIIEKLEKSGRKDRLQKMVDTSSFEVYVLQKSRKFKRAELESVSEYLNMNLVVVNDARKIVSYVHAPLKVSKFKDYFLFYNNKGERLAIYIEKEDD